MTDVGLDHLGAFRRSGVNFEKLYTSFSSIFEQSTVHDIAHPSQS